MCTLFLFCKFIPFTQSFFFEFMPFLLLMFYSKTPAEMSHNSPLIDEPTNRRTDGKLRAGGPWPVQLGK